MRIQASIHTQPLLFVAGLFYLMALTPLHAQAVSGQKTFSSPLEAVHALVEAARTGDPAQLEPLLGPQAPQLIASGEAGAAKELLAGFVKAYGEKHSLSVEAQGVEYLQVGSADWPFPFPLVRDGRVWYFDVDRGNQEIPGLAATNSVPSPCVRAMSKARSIMLLRDMTAIPPASMRSNFSATQASKTASTGPLKRASRRARWVRWSRALR
jgi:hypothetical protein